MSSTIKRNKYEIDMCNGTIMDKLISFSLPLMLSGILQLMFNAVDIIVIGRFSGSQSLAAVGSTTALINMFTNLFIGISLGANVLSARFYAAGKDKEMSETVHTAITLALISGIIMVFVGLIFAKPVLELMDTPDDVINLSTLYMRIYFMGMPFFMLYNYGASILRAVGDTKRPLFYLIVAGIANAGLNMCLVIIFHLGVAGVAIGTVISQLISSILVLRCLYRSETSYQLHFSKLKIQKEYLKHGIHDLILNNSLKSIINLYSKYVLDNQFSTDLAWALAKRKNNKKIFAQINTIIYDELKQEFPNAFRNDYSLEVRIYEWLINEFKEGMSYTQEHLEHLSEALKITFGDNWSLSTDKIGKILNQIYNIDRVKINLSVAVKNNLFYKNILPKSATTKKRIDAYTIKSRIELSDIKKELAVTSSDFSLEYSIHKRKTKILNQLDNDVKEILLEGVF